jgi:8-amino-7-oxononanoate synthase
MIALEKKIAKQSGQGLIATDTVFSMDGDRADIKGIDNHLNKNLSRIAH